MITSTANDRVKRIVTLREKSRMRSKEEVFIAEGLKMLEEAPLERLKELYIEEGLLQRLSEASKGGEAVGENGLLERLKACRQQGILIETVSREVFQKMSDTQAPQGVLMVLSHYKHSLEAMLAKALERKKETGREPLFLLLEDIQDPGNLGTMLRTGEGAGVDGVIMTRETVDIYNPKTIRSTMGSLYRVPFWYTKDLPETIGRMREQGISVYAAHLKGRKFYDEMRFDGGSAFLIGNEGKGLKKETADLADEYLKIPMEGKLESLNAAVAAALLMYRAAAFRRKSKTPL